MCSERKVSPKSHAARVGRVRSFSSTSAGALQEEGFVQRFNNKGSRGTEECPKVTMLGSRGGREEVGELDYPGPSRPP